MNICWKYFIFQLFFIWNCFFKLFDIFNNLFLLKIYFKFWFKIVYIFCCFFVIWGNVICSLLSSKVILRHIQPINQHICTTYIFSTLDFCYWSRWNTQFYLYIFDIIRMDKIIFIDDVSINCQPGYLNNQGIIDCWKTYKFRFIPISGIRNQCLQYCFNFLTRYWWS